MKKITQRFLDPSISLGGDSEVLNDINNMKLRLTSLGGQVEIYEKEISRQNINMIAVLIELAVTKAANITGVSSNVVIETFEDISDINIISGNYDASNKELYV